MEQAGKFAVSWEGAWSSMVEDANVAAGEIEKAFGGAIAGVDEELGVDGAAAGAASNGEKGAAAGDAEAGGEGFSLESLAPDAIQDTILGAITFGAADMSTTGVQGIANTASETGETPTQALALEMAMSAQGTGSNIENIVARLDKNVEGVQTKDGTVAQGNYVNLGSGKVGVNPSTLSEVQEGGKTGAAAALEELFPGGAAAAAATQLDSMNGSTAELVIIADKLEQIKNPQEKTAIVQDLFGRSGATSVLPFLDSASSDLSMAQSKISPDITTELNKALDASGAKTMASYQESLKLAETSFELAIVKLDPTLTQVAKAVTNLETWLSKHGSELNDVKNTVTAPFTAIKDAATGKSGGSGNASWETSLGAGGLIGGIDVAKAVLGGVESFGGSALHGAEGLLGDVFGASSASAATDAETQATGIQADYTAAKKYGVNAAAMIASQTNESAWVPDRVEGSTLADPMQRRKNSTSDASGLAQFLPSTWEADYKSTFGKAPSNDNAGSYSAAVQADVEAHTLSKSGIGTEKNPTAALKDIVTNFEQAGSKGDAGNIASGEQTLTKLEAALAKSDAATKPSASHASASDTTHTTPGGGGSVYGVTSLGHGSDFLTRPVASQAAFDILANTTNAGPHHGAAATDMMKAGEGGKLSTAQEKAVLQALEQEMKTASAHNKQVEAEMLADLEKMMSSGKATVDKTAPELPKGIVTALNVLVDDGLKYGDLFSTHVNDSMEKTRGYVESAKPKLNAAGIDAMEGLYNALVAEVPKLDNEARTIANNIEATIRDALDTHSPSEVMANVGADLVAGLGMGMQRGERSMNETAIRIGAGAAFSLGGGAGSAGGSASQPIHIENIIHLDGEQVGRTASTFLVDQLKNMVKTP